jgi:membrane peptidoglycan carboxypeptidase
VLNYAQRFGIESPLPAVPSLALGTGEVTLLELTSAYAVFANKGEHVEPTLIRRVESADGEVLYRAQSATRHVVSEDTAYLITNMLSDVIQRGTANNVRRLGFTAPAAGKTGTTDDVADAWFVGYTPRLAAGVWIGYDDPRAIRRGAFASTIAVPVWTSFMTAATPRRQGKGERAEQFEAPEGVEKVAYCPVSGEPAGPNCQLAQESRVRNAIVVTTDPVTGVTMATNVASAQDEAVEPAPAVYYDIARVTDSTQRCSVHAEWRPSDAPAYRAADAQTGYPSAPSSPSAQSPSSTSSSPSTGYDATRYPSTYQPAYERSSYSYQPPSYRPPASTYYSRTYQAPEYGAATPGIATSGVTTAARSAGTPSAPPAPPAPPLVGSDGRATTTVSTTNGVTRVVITTPGTTTSVPGTPAKPMMSPSDAANVIRRPPTP